MRRAAVLGLLALLVACPQPTPQVTQPVSIKPNPTPVAEAPFKPRLLGQVVVSLGESQNASVRAQGFVPNADLKFIPMALTTLDASSTERFLMAKFQVQNLNATTARSNLTLVAFHRRTPGAENVAGSPFGGVQTFGGTPVNVGTLRPANAMKTSGPSVIVDDANADLQIFKRGEITTLTNDAITAGLLNSGVTGEGVLNYGFVVRNGTGAAQRTIPANSNTSSVTLALRVPKSSDAGNGNTAYRYSMTFLVFEDTVTRVTESIEEQGAGSTAVTRAGVITGSSVATMCGTTNNASVFIPGVRTIGVGTDTTWIGGNFFDATGVTPSFAVVGNTEKTFTGLSGALNGRFTALGGATLGAAARSIASATTTQGGNLGIATNGNITIRPKVNFRAADSFTYQVSDGSCTSPNIVANMPAPSNTVWYVDSSAASGGDGRSHTPLQSLANLPSGTANNDFIYVKNGSTGSASFTPKTGQQLIGSGVALVVGADTLQAAGTAPTISSPIALDTTSNNTIRGLTIGALTGTNFGTLTINSASVNSGATKAIDLSTGTAAVSLIKVDSSGGVNAIVLSSVAGTFDINGTGTTAGSGGTITGHTEDAIKLTNNAAVTLKNMAIQNAQLDNVDYIANSGSSSLKIIDSVIQGAGLSAATVDHGLRLTASGTANATLEISSATAVTNPATHTSRMQSISSDAVLVDSTGSAVVNLTVNNVSFRDVNRAVNHNLNTSGASKFIITNNQITVPGNIATNGFRVDVNSTSAVTHNGRINNNTLAFPAGLNLGTGLGVLVAASRSAQLYVEIKDNTISNTEVYGIRGLSGVNTLGGNLQASVSGNVITGANDFAVAGIEMAMVSGSLGAQLCVNLQTNNASVSGVSVLGSYRLRQQTVIAPNPANTFQLQGLSGTTTTAATVQNAVVSSPMSNLPNNSGQVSISGIAAGFNPGTCAVPTGL